MLSALFIICMISTCYITSDILEITLFCKDNVAANILFVVGSLVLLVGLSRQEKVRGLCATLIEEENFNKVKKLLLAAIFILSIAWVLGTQFIPGSDQLDVMTSAYKLSVGDNSGLEAGGYLDRWSNQIGLTYIDYLLARVWGDYNVIIFQVLNAIGITLFYKKLVDTLDLFDVAPVIQLVTLFCGALFFPFWMYGSFVYGTIWSLTLAICAFYQEILFFRKYEWRRIGIGALEIALSIQVKNNAFIILIAMVIYGVLQACKDKTKWKNKIAWLIGICAIVTLLNAIPEKWIEMKTGYELSQGVSPWSFIAMGLQYEEHAPGWSNGYNYETYIENNCITELQTAVAKQEINDRVAYFKDNKRYTFMFFTRKIASMWTEPTYQSFWINQIRNHRVDFPEWLDNLMSAKGYSAAARLAQYFQILMFLGVILWIILEEKDLFVDRSFFLLCFVGGFLFHLFWEAKSQYSLSYVVMLIPYEVMGFGLFMEKLLAYLKTKSMETLTLNKFGLITCIASGVIFTGIYLIDGSDFLRLDGETYDTYLEDMVMPYTNESVLDINTIKRDKANSDDYIVYLEKILEENGIGY